MADLTNASIASRRLRFDSLDDPQSVLGETAGEQRPPDHIAGGLAVAIFRALAEDDVSAPPAAARDIAS